MKVIVFSAVLPDDSQRERIRAVTALRHYLRDVNPADLTFVDIGDSQTYKVSVTPEPPKPVSEGAK